MTARRDTIESLRQELERLELAAVNIRQVISNLESETTDRRILAQATSATRPRKKPAHTGHIVNEQCNRSVVRDRDGFQVNIGVRVSFPIRRRYRPTHGTVSHFSKNNERVFADNDDGVEIPRSPNNVRVVNDD